MTFKKCQNSIYISILRQIYLGIRLKKIDETRNYLLDEIKHNDLMSEKYKKIRKYSNYVEQF